MSILIKGMEMPEKGEYRMTLYVCDDGYAYMDVDLFPVDKDRFEAVPVPPHGDLIDRDKVLDDRPEIHEDYIDSDGYCWDSVWGYTDEQIKNAPTVIPADHEEEEMK